MTVSSFFRRHQSVIRILVVAGLLAAVFWVVDVSRAVAALSGAEWSVVVLALLFVQIQIVLSALRWRFTAARLGQAIGRREAVVEYYLASLLNMVLPGGVGGDAVRAARATSADAGRSSAVRAVVLERLAGQAAFFAIALCGIGLWPLLLRTSLPAGTLAVVALPLAIALACGFGLAVAARSAPERVRRALNNLGPDIRAAWFNGRAWIVQGGLSIAIAFLYIAVFALCSLAVGAPLPAAGWMTVIPLVLLTMLLPVSVGGFGLREGAAAALWPVVGLSPSSGLAAALLYGIVSIAGALPGLLVVLRARQAPPSSRA